MRLGRIVLLAAVPVLTSRAAADAVPTFNRDVAPLLHQRCAGCHRPGEVGPFALLSYADARKRGRQIAQVTGRGLMPPWKADAAAGEFRHDRRLSAEQIAVFRKWVEAGMPEGDAADLPPAPTFTDGWQLGTPDLVLKVPRPYTIPAEGRDVSVHFVLPLDFPRDTYLRGIEVRPENRRVTHHAVALLDSSGAARRLNTKAGGNGYVKLGSSGFVPRAVLVGYVPGQVNQFRDDDSVLTVGKGWDLVLQMHYHPTGKEETDLPAVGLYFTDHRPTRAVGLVLLGNEDVDIPAGKKKFRRVDSFRLPCAYEVRSVWGHMHLLGKEVRAWAELPDGSSRSLLHIADWDFNWQDTYTYARPIVLPPGTLLRAEFVWDNSADNPRNPHSPPKRVVLGEGSADEMAAVLLTGCLVDAQNEVGLALAVRGQYLDFASKGMNGKKKK
ncbi:MAG: c-type cytochrome [Gemmataceae bacterium]